MKLQGKTVLWLVLALLILIANFVLGPLLKLNLGAKHLLSIFSFALVCWIVCRIIVAVERHYIRTLPLGCPNYSFQVSGIKALSRLGQILALFILILIVLGILQIPMSGLVTVGGVGGIAVAFAGKDICSNFLGGIMIYLNRQFVVGDQISSPDRDIAGHVENMGWSYTVIRRAGGETMYVPNNIFSSLLLVNATRLAIAAAKSTS